jgi:hypothetical protein
MPVVYTRAASAGADSTAGADSSGSGSCGSGGGSGGASGSGGGSNNPAPVACEGASLGRGKRVRTPPVRRTDMGGGTFASAAEPAAHRRRRLAGSGADLAEDTFAMATSVASPTPPMAALEQAAQQLAPAAGVQQPGEQAAAAADVGQEIVGNEEEEEAEIDGEEEATLCPACVCVEQRATPALPGRRNARDAQGKRIGSSSGSNMAWPGRGGAGVGGWGQAISRLAACQASGYLLCS